MIDFTELKTRLQPPVRREVLIEIMAHGLNLSSMVKVVAYALVTRMPQNELDNMGGIAIEAIEYFERSDFEGLKAFLAKHNIPVQIINSIIDYASHISKIQ